MTRTKYRHLAGIWLIFLLYAASSTLIIQAAEEKNLFYFGGNAEIDEAHQEYRVTREEDKCLIEMENAESSI
mgnify:CR=1 FL=1